MHMSKQGDSSVYRKWTAASFKLYGKICFGFCLKGTLLGLSQFLVTESTLKMIKKCFLFQLKISFRSQDCPISDEVKAIRQ